jgi:hypothetical protein
MDELVRHRQPKEPETDRSALNHRATSRLYSRRFQLSLQTMLPIAAWVAIACTVAPDDNGWQNFQAIRNHRFV